MKGIALDFNGHTVKAGGYAGVIMSNKESGLRISLIGCDKNCSYTYFSHDLKIGDNIIVWYEDIDESDVSAPVSTLDYGNPDDVKRSVLNEYYRLRQELIDDGLLDA